jgi:hypothetical protein
LTERPELPFQGKRGEAKVSIADLQRGE